MKKQRSEVVYSPRLKRHVDAVIQTRPTLEKVAEHQLKYKAAEAAIQAVFGDTSVTREQTAEDLKSLRDFIAELAMTLH